MVMEFLAHVTELEIPVALLLFLVGVFVGSAITFGAMRRYPVE